MKNNIIKSVFIAAFLVGLSFSCGDDFLTQVPLGALDPTEVVGNQKGVEALLIGAYSVVDGTVGDTGDPWIATSSNWVFGSVAGGDAYKGSDASDQPSINEIESHTISANNPFINGKWKILYDGVSRSNLTLNKLSELPNGAISDADAKRITAEAKALRAFFHFEARKMWKVVPYLDEKTDPSQVKNDSEIYPKIIGDLQAAVEGLASSGMEKGRFNKWAAKALLGKVQLYSGDFAAAAATLQDVYSNGVTPSGVKYGLNKTFREAFNGDNDNSLESVFASQYTGSDGSNGFNASSGEVLNFPHNGTNGAPTNCCGFYQPSHGFVNSFRTDVATGLPFLDGSYNSAANEVTSDEFIKNGSSERLGSDDNSYVVDTKTVDPRLDWTVGRRGIPYLDWGLHPGQAWIRDGKNGGPFSPKKHVFNKKDVGVYTDASGWTAGYATNNYYIIRFSDVILMLAEAKIESNTDIAGAVTLINQVRSRAAVSTVPGSVATYKVGLYGTLTRDQARVAVRMERKLELGMEGHAFFDYARWGSTATDLNAYVNYERKWRGYLDKVSIGPEDTYYPIPQRQIDLSNGNLVQTN
jgi:starch-binding outer membrane protein, SusD/RagB family